MAQILKLAPMAYCDITRILHHNTKSTHHPGRWRLSREKMKKTTRKSQETMEYHLQMSRATAAWKWDIMRETARNQHIMLTQGHNHYRLDSPLHKKHPTSHKLISFILIGSCWTHAPLSSHSGIDTLFKASVLVTQANKSRSILIGAIRITVTPQPWRCYYSKCFTTNSTL